MRCKLALEVHFMGSFGKRFCIQVLILSAWLPSACFGQKPVPTFTYTLHAQKEPNPWSLVEIPTPPSTIIATTPTDALLVLIPQPDRKWVLKELSGWYAEMPEERSLPIRGSSVGRDEDAWITGDLTVTADGKYALVRITTRRRSTKPDTFDVEARLTTVDLNTFTALNNQTTTNPLIAGAQWSLAPQNVLISDAITKTVRTDRQGSIVSQTHQAAILDLPDLKASDTCDYSKGLELHAGSGWQIEDEKTANLKCVTILKAANVAKLDDLPGENRTARFAEELHAPPTCKITGVSDDAEFALYDCSQGHQAWDRAITSSRSLLVLSATESVPVISVSLKPKQPTVFILAVAKGRDYLIVVRDGTQVEAYPVH